MRRSKRHIYHKNSGFTLFEICIAMAMIAIGFLAVLAVISSGIQTAQKAKVHFTGPLTARSLGVYFMAKSFETTDAPTLLGDAPITVDTAADPANVAGMIPGLPTDLDGTVHEPTTVHINRILPFNQYVIRIENIEPLEGDVDDNGMILYELVVDLFETVEDRDADPPRNRVDRQRILVYRTPYDE